MENSVNPTIPKTNNICPKRNKKSKMIQDKNMIDNRFEKNPVEGLKLR